MEITTSYSSGRLTLHLSGELDHHGELHLERRRGGLRLPGPGRHDLRQLEALSLIHILGLHPVSLGKTKEMGWNGQHKAKPTASKTASSSNCLLYTSRCV